VRCNAVFHGAVNSPLLQDCINLFEIPIEARKKSIACQSMGQLAYAREIAPLVVFLTGNKSAFVTAQAYGIDGCMTI
jgi:NAD(P)-dependent dehydrogenase (short-subunit alcohol dehydrogenase family)